MSVKRPRIHDEDMVVILKALRAAARTARTRAESREIEFVYYKLAGVWPSSQWQGAAAAPAAK